MTIKKDFLTAGLQRTQVKLSDGRTVKIRAMAIKEKKLLEMAVAGGGETFQATDILDSCIDDEIETAFLPAHDVERLYVELYKVSKATSLTPVDIECSCGNVFKVMANLNGLTFIDECKTELELSGGVSVSMRYPTVFEMEAFEHDSANDRFNFAVNCITKIDANGQTLTVGQDISKEELSELFDYMTVDTFHDLIKWVDTLPRLEVHIPCKCSECDHEEVVILKGLSDFFA